MIECKIPNKELIPGYVMAIELDDYKGYIFAQTNGLYTVQVERGYALSCSYDLTYQTASSIVKGE